MHKTSDLCRLHIQQRPASAPAPSWRLCLPDLLLRWPAEPGGAAGRRAAGAVGGAAAGTEPAEDVSDRGCASLFSRCTAMQNLAGLLGAEQLGRWEELELAQSLQRMPDVVFCPRCSSACLEDAQNCAQCPKCFFAFCSLCNESWHPGIEVCRDPFVSACPEGHP